MTFYHDAFHRIPSVSKQTSCFAWCVRQLRILYHRYIEDTITPIVMESLRFCLLSAVLTIMMVLFFWATPVDAFSRISSTTFMHPCLRAPTTAVVKHAVRYKRSDGLHMAICECPPHVMHISDL